jgi:hypothetical protein
MKEFPIVKDFDVIAQPGRTEEFIDLLNGALITLVTGLNDLGRKAEENWFEVGEGFLKISVPAIRFDPPGPEFLQQTMTLIAMGGLGLEIRNGAGQAWSLRHDAEGHVLYLQVRRAYRFARSFDMMLTGFPDGFWNRDGARAEALVRASIDSLLGAAEDDDEDDAAPDFRVVDENVLDKGVRENLAGARKLLEKLRFGPVAPPPFQVAEFTDKKLRHAHEPNWSKIYLARWLIEKPATRWGIVALYIEAVASHFLGADAKTGDWINFTTKAWYTWADGTPPNLHLNTFDRTCWTGDCVELRSGHFHDGAWIPD